MSSLQPSKFLLDNSLVTLQTIHDDDFVYLSALDYSHNTPYPMLQKGLSCRWKLEKAILTQADSSSSESTSSEQIKENDTFLICIDPQFSHAHDKQLAYLTIPAHPLLGSSLYLGEKGKATKWKIKLIPNESDISLKPEILSGSWCTIRPAEDDSLIRQLVTHREASVFGGNAYTKIGKHTCLWKIFF